MSLFRKKEKPRTIQEIQQEIMDLQFSVLKGFLEMNALKYKMKELEVDTNKKIQTWEKLTKQINETKEKIKDEIDETISLGKRADETLI